MTEKKPNPIPPTVAGRRGGLARKRSLSREERRAIAQAAAVARWDKTPAKARSDGARKAVLARWERAKAGKAASADARQVPGGKRRAEKTK